jgi:hypothetical protein
MSGECDFSDTRILQAIQRLQNTLNGIERRVKQIEDDVHRIKLRQSQQST